MAKEVAAVLPSAIVEDAWLVEGAFHPVTVQVVNDTVVMTGPVFDRRVEFTRAEWECVVEIMTDAFDRLDAAAEAEDDE